MLPGTHSCCSCSSAPQHASIHLDLKDWPTFLILPTTLPQQASRAARANAYAFIDAGGLQLLVDLAACAHEQDLVSCSTAVQASGTGSTTGQAAVQPVTLLTAHAHEDVSHLEWFFYPGGTFQAVQQPSGSTDQPHGSTDGSSAASGQQLEGVPRFQPDANGRAGPISKSDMRQLYDRGVIGPATLVWCTAMSRPLPLGSIRELRWWVSRGPSLFSPREGGQLALAMLQQLVCLQPALDETGAVLQPLPRVLRVLGSPSSLPHLCQLIMSHDPELVPMVAGLLCDVLSHNRDALARVYLTGEGCDVACLHACMCVLPMRRDSRDLHTMLQKEASRQTSAAHSMRLRYHISHVPGLSLQLARAQSSNVLNHDAAGVFYFALSYAGSNLSEIGRLLALGHLSQATRYAL